MSTRKKAKVKIHALKYENIRGDCIWPAAAEQACPNLIRDDTFQFAKPSILLLGGQSSHYFRT